jgi:hypothetical protein
MSYRVITKISLTAVVGVPNPFTIDGRLYAYVDLGDSPSLVPYPFAEHPIYLQMIAPKEGDTVMLVGPGDTVSNKGYLLLQGYINHGEPWGRVDGYPFPVYSVSASKSK